MSWVVLGACCVLGLIVGILLIKYEKVAVFILGAVGGYFLATVLYAAILYRIGSSQVFLFTIILRILNLVGLMGICNHNCLDMWIYRAQNMGALHNYSDIVHWILYRC